MEDAVFMGQGTARSNGDFVMRTFSPVRIERLLLTRLFDLTTGHAVADSGEGPGTCRVSKTAVRDVGKEAA